VVYLCTEGAAYVTGQVFWVDGGLFLRSGQFGGDNQAAPSQ
jgi:hypothetical protein